MKELSLEELHSQELEIMIKIDEICRSQNITYYIHYGTLLGAVRHKGFIPWDDDLDIIMPRVDYERFLDYMREHKDSLKPLELIHYSVNKKYIYPIARVSDSRFKIDYQDAVDYGLGVFVDIYPYDGCGNTRQEAKQIVEGLEKEKQLIRLAGIDHFVPSPLGKFRSIIKHISFYAFKLVGPTFFLKRIDRMCKKRSYDDCKYVNCTVWNYIFFEKEWFEPAEMEFEGHSFIGPKHYDEILTATYGNYMELPPEDERKGHHNYIAYRK